MPLTNNNSITSSINSIRHKNRKNDDQKLVSGSHGIMSSISIAEQGPVKMKKEINLLYAASIMIGIMIGSGIFVSPVSIAQNCGSIGLALMVWVLSGILVLFIALCYAELGGMLPSAGGDYVYMKHIYGDLIAFLYAWAAFVALNPCFYAVLALTTSYYLFKPFYADCDVPQWAVKLLSAWIILTLVFLNSVYVKYVTRVQVLFTVAKMIPLVAIVIMGMTWIIQGKAENLQNIFEGTTSDGGRIAVAMYSGIFTYSGWQFIFMLIEEVKEPKRIVPQATMMSFVGTIGAYLLVNVSYFSVLTIDDMASSSAVAVSFAERTMGWFSMIIPIFVACSCIGALNGSILGGSRICYAAARDELFPQVLAMLSVKYKTPIPSVWATCLISMLYLFGGDPVSLIEYLGFLVCITFCLSVSGVLILRYREPERKRPLKVPLYIAIFSCITIISLTVLGIVLAPSKTATSLLIVLAGIPFYLFGVCWKNKPKIINNFIENATINTQKMMWLLHEDES